MKNMDIRKIYVCQIAKQSNVSADTEQYSVWGKVYEVTSNARWNYVKKLKYGLFRKTLSGYKHILTQTSYPVASSTTGGQYVVIPETIEKLTQKERDACIELIQKNGSFNVDIEDIKTLEDQINSETEALNEDQKQ